MKTSNSARPGRTLLSLAIGGIGTLLVAGAIGCNSDASIPESEPAPAMDPATAGAGDIDAEEGDPGS